MQHVWFKLHDHGRIVFLNQILHSELYSAWGHFQFASRQKYTVETVVLLTTHIFSKHYFFCFWVWGIVVWSPGFLCPTAGASILSPLHFHQVLFKFHLRNWDLKSNEFWRISWGSEGEWGVIEQINKKVNNPHISYPILCRIVPLGLGQYRQSSRE